MGSFSIASLNTFGATLKLNNMFSRYKKICQYFNSSDVDIINFQEIFSYYHLWILKKDLINFPYHSYEKDLFSPKGGLVTFSKIPFERSFFINYKRKNIPRSRILIEKLIHRGVLISEIRGYNLHVLNTHLTVPINEEWSKKSIYYIELASEIEQLNRQVQRLNKNVIITGDFNISKGSDLYSLIVKKYKFIDVFKSSNTPTIHQKPICIDYIFLSKDTSYTINRAEYIFEKQENNKDFLSDHIGLKADFSSNT